ncbi:NifU N-terminal domain-containing protein [Anaerobacillus sp. MEB173]|uniref:NifU N-terminal domain-containing protein n=1 Tax=Anaerobacillus sp. MEB173 TaxID=3383345 RepID=UPI003F8E3F69
MPIDITIDPTPNPNAMKLTANRTLFEGSGSTSVRQGQETDHPLANALLKIDGVDNIFGFNDFVTINKTADGNWDQILADAQKAFEEVYE